MWLKVVKTECLPTWSIDKAFSNQRGVDGHLAIFIKIPLDNSLAKTTNAHEGHKQCLSINKRLVR